MTEDKKYASEEIKKAFWENFYESGEWWFGDKGTSDKDKLIEDAWKYFIDALKAC
jgi:hypothetical protein